MRHIKIGRHKHNYKHPREPRYISHHPPSPIREFKGTLRVISYNIKHSRKIHKAIELLSNHAELDNADIICLQEMTPIGVKRIAETLHYNYIYYPAILHPRIEDDFGNAILSKWPICDDEKIILPQLGRGPLQRIAVKATLKIEHTQVTVFSVHMKVFVWQHLRRVPIDIMLNSLEPDTKHCIVAGDFNTFSQSSCQTILEPFQTSGFQLATEKIGWTYKHWYLLNKKSTLDHIFTKGMHVVQAGKVIDRTPSDHMPIWGELKLNLG